MSGECAPDCMCHDDMVCVGCHAATVDRLTEEAYARGKADGMAEANIAQMLSDSFAHGKDAELAKVVAWLHGRDGEEMYSAHEIADSLERGEHKK